MNKNINSSLTFKSFFQILVSVYVMRVGLFVMLLVSQLVVLLQFS